MLEPAILVDWRNLKMLANTTTNCYKRKIYTMKPFVATQTLITSRVEPGATGSVWSYYGAEESSCEFRSGSLY
jgi:hypothetical protein